MNQGQRRGFGTKYAAPLLTILIFLSLGGDAQTYNPSQHSVVNSAMGVGQASPVDARSMYWDNTNQVYRAFQNTSEVLSYLNLPKYRYGNFMIVVDSGGSLQPNGVYVGGVNLFYMFKDSTANANLVRLNLTGGAGVTSFGPSGNVRSGAVVPATGDYTFAQIGSPPTTILGYGITDAVSLGGTQTLTNKTISGLSNTLVNIPNSALVNTSIGLSLGTSGTDINVGVTPAQLGSSLLLNIPNAGPGSRGVISASNYNYFSSKIDSVHFSGDSIYDCTSGTCTFRGFVTGTGGIGSLNGLTATTQTFGTGTSGSDFNIISAGSTHTFNFPNASGSNRGLLLAADWTTFNSKQTQLNGTGLVRMAGTSVSYDNNAYITNISGLVTNGTGISVTGAGTSGSPFVITATSSGSGTVTSVSQTVPSSLLTISGSPITVSGTLAIGLSTAAANSIWGNNTGSTATPAYFVPTSTTLNGWFGGAIQGLITLTTTGTSGAATLIGNTLNVPNYAGGVTGVSNSDGTLTISPTSGAVVASLNLSHSNTWVPLQTFGTLTTTGVTKMTGIASGSANDSILTINPSTGQVTWRTGQPYNIYPVQGLSVTGTTNPIDSFKLGGILGAFFQPDTLYTEYQGLYIYHLNSKATLSAGDSVMILDANKQAKLVPSSAIGGGGAVSSVSDNGGGTLTISPTTGAVLAGLNLGNANTWTASQTMGADLLASTNATINIGSGTNNFANVGAREIKSNGGLILAQAGTNPIQMQANGVNVFEMFGATKDFVINRSGTLVDDSKSLLHVVGKTTIDSALVLNNVTAPPGTYNVLVHGLGDSTTYQVPASAFGGVGQLFTNNQGIGIAGTDTVRQNNLAFVDPTNNGILGINWSGGYDSASWNNFAYLQTNSGTSIVATKIRITEADNTHTNYVRLPTNTCLDQQNLIVGYKIITTNAGDSGMPIRFQSNNPHSVSTVGAYLNPTTKRVMLYSNQNGTVTLYASAPLTTAPVATDSIGLSLVNNYQIWTATATDYATNQTVSITFVNTFIFGQPYVVANTGQVTIFAPNGNYEVDNWIYSSNMPRNQNMGVLGYSITQGFYGGSIAADWARIVTGSVSNGSTVSAGSADYTSSILLPGRLQELHALGYRNWLIGGLIGNDAAAAIAIGTSGPNLVAIYDSIISWGSNVYFSLETPRNATNMTQVDSFMTANWPTLCINVNTPFLGSGTSLNGIYDAGDGTHLNAAGHALYVQSVEQSFQYNLILHGGIIPTFTPVTPGGPTTSVQINSGTGFIGYAGLEYSNSLNELFSANIAGSQTGGQNLILHSNSALGNGLIGLGSASAFNESNSRLGIGTNAPTAPLDIRGSVAGLNASFGTTDKFTIYPDYAGNGDIPANSVLIGAGVGGLFFSANTSAGTAGNKLGFDYYNGTAQTSGIELANVASGTSILYFMPGGGKVIEFQHADSATANFQVNGAAWIADSVELKNVRTGTTADSVLVWQFLSPGKGVVHRVAQSSLGGGVTTVGTFSGSSIANGASISGATITFGPAGATNPGMITTGTQTIAGDKTFTGSIAFTGNVTEIGALNGNSGTPSISGSTGAGSSPTLSLSGTNICGVIQVTPGTGAAGTNAVVVTVTFANSLAFFNAPIVMLTPGNSATALLSGATMVYTSNTNQTSFTLNAGTTGLTPATLYIWNYHVMGY